MTSHDLVFLLKLGLVTNLDEHNLTIQDLLNTGKIKTEVVKLYNFPKSYLLCRVLREDITFISNKKEYKYGSPLLSWKKMKRYT